MILDTNAVSALLAGDQQLGRVLDNVEHHHLPLIVIGEFQFGLLFSRKRKRLQSLLGRLEAESILLSPDRETADWYAQIRHDLKKQGQPIPENDLWISALARQHAMEIVSQDTHFDHVPGVRRVGW
ncbi:MAG: type II toxin-antitoxin system VapC family toxin [Pirellulaceae bacterium]